MVKVICSLKVSQDIQILVLRSNHINQIIYIYSLLPCARILIYRLNMGLQKSFTTHFSPLRDGYMIKIIWGGSKRIKI